MATVIRAGVLCPIRYGCDGLETLLVRRAFWDCRHKRPMTFAGEWVSPGGCKEQGDADLLASAIRETREELGYGGSIVRPRFLRTATLQAYGVAYMLEFFAGEFDSGKLVPNRDEIIAVQWMRPDDALYLMRSEAFTQEQLEAYRALHLDRATYGVYAATSRVVPVETMHTLELLEELV